MQRFTEAHQSMRFFHLFRPRLRSATFPKGEGFFRCPTSHGLIDELTDTGEILQNICIGETQNQNTNTIQIRIPFRIVYMAGFLIMLGTIQFHSKLSGSAVKIQNESADSNLSAKTERVAVEIFIPQFPFFFRHISAQFLCPGCKFFVVIHGSSINALPFGEGGFSKCGAF